MGSMDSFQRLYRKFQLLFRRKRFADELDEEMAFHRDASATRYEAEGMNADDARYSAQRQFGNSTLLREQSYETVSFPWESVTHDLRFAVRQLRKNAGFACTAILVLALGVAASVTIFAFVDAALLKGLPYEKPSRLVGVFEKAAECPRCNLSYQDYLDWKKNNTVFQSLEVWEPTAFLWQTPSGAEFLRAVRVTGTIFKTLGVQTALGRTFTEADDTPSAPRTAILAYGAWQQRFGGRRDVIGQVLSLDGEAYTVIGVLPKRFQFAPRSAEFWVTIHTLTDCEKRRSCHDLDGLARLKDGVTVKEAVADTTTIAAQLEKEYPGSNKGQGAEVMSMRDAIVGDIQPILLVLLCGAGLLLLIACVNVASLLLVRAENRKREMALRGALGASPVRLMRLFITEGAVLVAVALMLGLAAAYVAMQLMLKMIPEQMMRGMPYMEGIGLHWHVLVFAGVVGLIAATIFAATPALRLSLANLRDDLAEGGRAAAGTTWKRFGSYLVSAELAIAMVLLAGGGLLGQSFYRLLHVNLNFDPNRLATMDVEAPPAEYAKPEQQVALTRRIVERLSAIPGVLSVGHTSDLPVTCHCDTTWFRVKGKPWNGEHNDSPMRDISPGYFPALHAQLVSGRFFTMADDAKAPPVIMINRVLAKKFFPGEDPIGATIGNLDLAPDSLRKVVGVVDDVREGTLDQEISPAVYYPYEQDGGGNGFSLVVRTAQEPGPMIPALIAAIHQVDPTIGVRNERTMLEHINDSGTAYLHRSSAWLVGGFAVLALLLGVVGLYGVIAYSVSQRTREIGVRMALGARRGAVYGLILREAGMVIAIGIAAGLACSIAASALMRGLLFGIRAWDISTLLSVALILGGCAMAASFLPARRAASVNPVEALRAE
jgi:predicted permease